MVCTVACRNTQRQRAGIAVLAVRARRVVAGGVRLSNRRGAAPNEDTTAVADGRCAQLTLSGQGFLNGEQTRGQASTQGQKQSGCMCVCVCVCVWGGVSPPSEVFGASTRTTPPFLGAGLQRHGGLFVKAERVAGNVCLPWRCRVGRTGGSRLLGVTGQPVRPWPLAAAGTCPATHLTAVATAAAAAAAAEGSQPGQKAAPTA